VGIGGVRVEGVGVIVGIGVIVDTVVDVGVGEGGVEQAKINNPENIAITINANKYLFIYIAFTG
jgi:hypothetical protein